VKRLVPLLALFALTTGLAVFAPSCGLQGVGQWCDINNNGNGDCDTSQGLVCTPASQLNNPSNTAICCPGPGYPPSSNPACVPGALQVTGSGGGGGGCATGGAAGGGTGGAAGGGGTAGAAGTAGAGGTGGTGGTAGAGGVMTDGGDAG
jgi:hypothetical protein